MTTRTTGQAVAFDAYWAALDRDVRAQAAGRVTLEELKMRSNESSTVYAARFNGISGYPLFAYYSVPVGGGPFPALFEAPSYGSVRAVPAVERRAKYVVMGICHRGQRLSDGMYKSAYPGLLTEGLPGAGAYRWRDVVADCLRAFDVMAARPEVDKSRIGVAGNDLAAIVAGLRPDVKCLLLNGQLLFRDTPARLTAGINYPLDEFNDFRRANSGQWDEAAKTLALYDPIAFAPAITSETLIACLKGDAAVAEPLARAIKGKCELRVNSGKGFLDHEYQEEWLATRLLVK